MVIPNLEINKEKCIESCTQELFATDYAYELVKKGTPFRDAYMEITKNISTLEKTEPIKNIKSKKYIGVTGNFGLEKLKNEINLLNKNLDFKIKEFNSKIGALLK